MTEATAVWTQWPAPAKLNLFLHIVGRRTDGYHLLQTVFQLLDWGDEVRLRVRRDGQVLRSGTGFQATFEQDLCLRAALALKQLVGSPLGADIGLVKHIPGAADLAAEARTRRPCSSR
jgi:4-diphosphocytidyl-2-C-methyl-D-erythritol kinase